MIESSSIWILLLGGVIALIFGAKQRKKKGSTSAPPKDTSASVAREIAARQMKENLDEINDALEGDQASDALAQKGNERRRR